MTVDRLLEYTYSTGIVEDRIVIAKDELGENTLPIVCSCKSNAESLRAFINSYHPNIYYAREITAEKDQLITLNIQLL